MMKQVIAFIAILSLINGGHMKVTFYTTDCPKCGVLKSKLDQHKIPYEENHNVKEMLSLGLQSAPALKVDDGPVMTFFEAVRWVNNWREDGDN